MGTLSTRPQQQTDTRPGHRRFSRPVVLGLLVVAVFAVAVEIWLQVHARLSAHMPYRVYTLQPSQAGEWQAMGGNWQFHDGIVQSRHGDDRSAKLLAGSPEWRNYTLTADLQFRSERGDIGLIFRSEDEQKGTDAYNGYYVGLRSDGGTLIIGRSNYGWVEARPVPLPGGFQALHWYRLRITGYGCNIAANVENLDTAQTAWVAFEDRSCVQNGRIGLRSVDVDGAWRNVTVGPATQADYLAMRQHTDEVEQPIVLTGPPWWTPWHLGEVFLCTLAAALLLQLAFHRFQQWKADAILEERQRLAHDIHDTMAQNFAGLGYHIQGIRSGVLRGSYKEPQQVAEQLGLAYQLIRRCHTEASETIQMLGSSALSEQQELSITLAEAASRIASSHIVVDRRITGAPLKLSLRLADALQHIGREAIANAVTHSALSQLSITVHYEPRRVELIVRDNGKGFLCGPEPRGFGLAGMQKRARDVRATLVITSDLGTGTEVRVCSEVRPSLRYGTLWKKLCALLQARWLGQGGSAAT